MMTHGRKTGMALAMLVTLLGAAPRVAAQTATGRPQQSLYDRLGGLAPISLVVNDFIDALVPDSTLNANPAIDAARRRVPPSYLKYHVTTMVCQATGGPCTYHGRGMRESHAHLRITEREWDRMVALLNEVLAKYRVPARDSQDLLAIVATTRADIVAPTPQP